MTNPENPTYTPTNERQSQISDPQLDIERDEIISQAEQAQKHTLGRQVLNSIHFLDAEYPFKHLSVMPQTD